MKTDAAVDILYVEDDPLAARLLEEVCQSSKTPSRVRTASTREEAVDELTTEEPDLLLVSMEFGAVDGLGVLNAISERVDISAVPVVVFGNTDDDDEILATYECGVDAYIQKPPNFSELLGIVEPLAAAPRQAALVGMTPKMSGQPRRELA